MKPSTPLVTSVSTHLKKTYDLEDTKVSTPEQIKDTKRKLLNIVDEATNQFLKNLQEHKVELTSTLDLDRLVKLALLLSGEPDSISKTSNQSTLETDIVSAGGISNTKLLDVLDTEDIAVKSIYDKLYAEYNESNDNK